MSNGFIGPTIPPDLEKYGSPWGYLGVPKATDETGDMTATTSGFPWSLLTLIVPLLQTIFKKSPTQEAEDLKKQMAVLGLQAPYQSPYASAIDPVVLKALLAQLNRTSNWGWPAGKGIDTSFIQEALNKIGTIQTTGTGGGKPSLIDVIRRGQLGG